MNTYQYFVFLLLKTIISPPLVGYEMMDLVVVVVVVVVVVRPSLPTMTKDITWQGTGYGVSGCG